MKRALLIGIDDYDHVGCLKGCANDVAALEPLLALHEDNDPNFSCISYTSRTDRLDRSFVVDAVEELFAPGVDIALFYFAGHGDATSNDVVLVTQEGQGRNLGIPFSQILGTVQNSLIKEIIVILDCCFSGGAGGVPQLGGTGAMLREGVTILSASRKDQPAGEMPIGRGMFSYYLCGGLEGGAADVLGKVTVAGLYAYLSESFGPWGQRPTFKSNLDRLHELRICSPAVPFKELRRLPNFFTTADTDLPLDPSFEPDLAPSHPENEETFAILQRCRAAKLLTPVDADHMYYAARNSKSCRLTPLGKHYWRLVRQGQI